MLVKDREKTKDEKTPGLKAKRSEQRQALGKGVPDYPGRHQQA